MFHLDYSYSLNEIFNKNICQTLFKNTFRYLSVIGLKYQNKTILILGHLNFKNHCKEKQLNIFDMQNCIRIIFVQKLNLLNSVCFTLKYEKPRMCTLEVDFKGLESKKN